MGPIRRGIVLACIPVSAAAEVCDKERPYWVPGTSPTHLSEAFHLYTSPFGLFALGTFLLACLFRKSWLFLVSAIVFTLLLAPLVADSGFSDPSGIRQAGINEGCIGPQNGAVVLTAAFAAASILLAWKRFRSNNSGQTKDS